MTSRADRNARRRATYARLKLAGYSVREASRLSGSAVRGDVVNRHIASIFEMVEEFETQGFIPEDYQNLIQTDIEELGSRPSRTAGSVIIDRFPDQLNDLRLRLAGGMPQESARLRLGRLDATEQALIEYLEGRKGGFNQEAYNAIFSNLRGQSLRITDPNYFYQAAIRSRQRARRSNDPSGRGRF